MTPSQTKTVNGHRVEEYYWNGKYTVYVDNSKFDGTFRDAVAKCMTEEEMSKLT